MATIVYTAKSGFKYPQLEHLGQIRLVTVTGATSNGVLCCSLNCAELDKRPRYNALSYVWGSGPAKYTILVNGQRFSIRESLHAFLTTVAAKTFPGTPVFIDAICIDQTDIHERNHQVKLMREVYSSAATVVAWLGPVPELEPRSLALTRQLLVYMNGHIRAGDVENVVLDSYLNTSDEALNVLFAALTLSPFWHRLWIIQELVLSKALVLYCGDTIVSQEHPKAAWMLFLERPIHIGPLMTCSHKTMAPCFGMTWCRRRLLAVMRK